MNAPEEPNTPADDTVPADAYQPPTGSYEPGRDVDVTPSSGYSGGAIERHQGAQPPQPAPAHLTPYGYATAPHAQYHAQQGQWQRGQHWQQWQQGQQWRPGQLPVGTQPLPQPPHAGGGSSPRKQPIGWIIAAATAATVIGLVTGGLGVASLAAGAFQSVAASSQVTELAPEQGQSFRGPGSGQTAPQQQTTPDTATANTRDATAAESVGVVDIQTELAYQGAAAAGTGMILTADGQILTNNHVVAGATSIVVTVVSTGQQYTARVVGTDATNDVALLQLEGASGLDTVAIDQDGVSVGEAVTGVGNAGGTGGTPSAADGSVTALEQDITVQDETTGAGKQLTGLIQTDADIQSGDSGGPLYDADGEVVGVDTAASSGGTEIDGFAIPIDDALAVVDQIRSGVETDTVSIGYPAFIGISLQTGGQGAAQSTAGAVVGAVIEGTPASAIGLAAGDVITSLNGVAIDSAATLTATTAGLEPGQTVSITWTDASGTSQTAQITLAEGPVS